MTPGQNTKFFATIDEHVFSLAKTINTMIGQLADVAQEKGKLSAYIASLLHQHGFTEQLLNHDEKFLVCGRCATKETQTLLLFSSCPPQPTAFARWSTFVMRLLTFALYHETIGSMPLSIVWLIDTEEHDENDDVLARFVKENATWLQGNGCLYDLPAQSFFPTPCLALGTKGLLSVEMEVQTAFREHHTLDGAILPDAAWRLIWALSSLKDSREEIHIEGFYDTLMPMDDEELAAIRTMTAGEQRLKQRLGVDEFLLQLHGFQLQYTHLLLPTCTVSTIHSGRAAPDGQHAMPSFAKASVDIHLVPRQEPGDIYMKLRKHLDLQGFQDVHTTAKVSRSPQYTPLRHPFSSSVYKSACRLYGENIPTFPLLPEHHAYYPLQSLLNIPVVYTQIGTSLNQLYEHDTVMGVEDAERQTHFVANGMKHIALIIEDIAGDTRR